MPTLVQFLALMSCFRPVTFEAVREAPVQFIAGGAAAGRDPDTSAAAAAAAGRAAGGGAPPRGRPLWQGQRQRRGVRHSVRSGPARSGHGGGAAQRYGQVRPSEGLQVALPLGPSFERPASSEMAGHHPLLLDTPGDSED